MCPSSWLLLVVIVWDSDGCDLLEGDVKSRGENASTEQSAVLQQIERHKRDWREETFVDDEDDERDDAKDEHAYDGWSSPFCSLV